MAQWVCSRFIEGREPKDEEKWKVISDYTDEYEVGAHSPTVNSGTHWLPKSDYIPCEPPEQWERVEELKLGNPDGRHLHFYDGAGNLIGDVEFQHAGYRVVSLVVERRRA